MNELIARDCKAVVQALEDAVRRNLTDGMLLSGGLDTSILACLASRYKKPECVTVALRNSPAPDVEYAKLMSRRLGLKHYVHYFGDNELEESIRSVVSILKTFDPMEVRNSATIYAGLKTVKKLGISSIMTGDAGDELFAGYSFFFGLTGKQLATALKKLWAVMGFSSVDLGRALGIEVKIPFLDPEFKNFATSLDASLKVRHERGQMWGKWILRKAFESVLPEEIIWRVKAPIEEGSGTTILPSVFEQRIPDSEFNSQQAKFLKEDGVRIRSKEHLYYYEIYRNIIGVPHALNKEQRSCPDCQANVKATATYCPTCGAYPITMEES